MSETKKGLVSGVTAYALWGIAPLYWKLLDDVWPVETIAHRAIWGLVTFAALAAVAGRAGAVRDALRDRRIVARMALSAALLSVNWGLFVGAIATGHLLEASLGYFINPLVSVALGTLVLGERLRRLQWLAIGLAAAAVTILGIQAGTVPWISLLLAGTWATYGLVRKTAPVDSLVGSTIETALVTPVALVLIAARGGGVFGADATTSLLLLGTGAVTAVPLLLFTVAARRLPLSTVGFLQYLAPTGQFLLAVLVFDEPLADVRLLAFGLIWVALAVFSLDLWNASRVLRSSLARS